MEDSFVKLTTEGSVENASIPTSHLQTLKDDEDDSIKGGSIEIEETIMRNKTDRGKQQTNEDRSINSGGRRSVLELARSFDLHYAEQENAPFDPGRRSVPLTKLVNYMQEEVTVSSRKPPKPPPIFPKPRLRSLTPGNVIQEHKVSSEDEESTRRVHIDSGQQIPTDHSNAPKDDETAFSKGETTTYEDYTNKERVDVFAAKGEGNRCGAPIYVSPGEGDSQDNKSKSDFPFERDISKKEDTLQIEEPSIETRSSEILRGAFDTQSGDVQRQAILIQDDRTHFKEGDKNTCTPLDKSAKEFEDTSYLPNSMQTAVFHDVRDTQTQSSPLEAAKTDSSPNKLLGTPHVVDQRHCNRLIEKHSASFPNVSSNENSDVSAIEEKSFAQSHQPTSCIQHDDCLTTQEDIDETKRKCFAGTPLIEGSATRVTKANISPLPSGQVWQTPSPRQTLLSQEQHGVRIMSPQPLYDPQSMQNSVRLQNVLRPSAFSPVVPQEIQPSSNPNPPIITLQQDPTHLFLNQQSNVPQHQQQFQGYLQNPSFYPNIIPATHQYYQPTQHGTFVFENQIPQQQQNVHYPQDYVSSQVTSASGDQRLLLGRSNQSGTTSAGRLVQVQTQASSSSTITSTTTVRVDGLDESIDMDHVTLYFESEKSGGGLIVDTVDRRGQGFVLLTFKDPEVLYRILQRNHTLSKKSLKVTLVSDKQLNQELRTVEVHGGDNIKDIEIIELYFENTNKSGGGKIQTCTVDDQTGVIRITFMEEKAAVEVLKRPHTLCGTQLIVNAFKPSSNIQVTGVHGQASKEMPKIPKKIATVGSKSSSETRPPVQKTLEKMPDKIPDKLPDKIPDKVETKSASTPLEPLTVEVQGLDKSTTKDTIELYFENTRRSGGDEITEIHVDQRAGRAFITFKDAAAVKRVLEKTHTLDNKQLKVKVCESKPICNISALSQDESTVAVRGLKPSTSNDLLLNYFENNRRSGGGSVKEIIRHQEKGVVYITFNETQAAKTVASRTHTLDSHQLQVCIERPPEMMQDRVVLHGLPYLTCSEDLVDFVEKSTSLVVQSVLFGDDDGVAVVVFKTDILFQDVQSSLSQNLLKNQTLTIDQVPMSSTIIVRFQENQRPSEDMLCNYFENNRRSGGGDVSKTEFGKDRSWALVTFVKVEDAKSVSSRRHAIEGYDLEVSLFTECLGISGGSREPKIKPLEPIAIHKTNERKIGILKSSPVQFSALESALQKRHTSLDFSDPAGGVFLTCILTPSDSKYRQIAESWAQDATNALEDYLQHVVVEEIQMSAEEFTEAETILHKSLGGSSVKITFNHKEKQAYVLYEKDEHINVKPAIHNVKETLNRKRLETNDDLPVEKAKLILLQKGNVAQYLLEQYPNFTMLFNFEKCCLEFKGTKEEINEAKSLVQAALLAVDSKSHVWDSTLAVQLFAAPETRSAFEHSCLGHNSNCVLEFTENGFKVHSFDEMETFVTLEKGKNALRKECIPLSAESEEQRKLSEWRDLKNSLLERHGKLAIMQETSQMLTILSLKESLHSDVQPLKMYLEETSIEEIRLPVKQIFSTMLLHFMRERQQGDHFRIDDIDLDENKSNIVIKGNKTGVKRAREIKELFEKNLVVQKRKFTEPCMREFLKSTDWKHHCKYIEERFKCKILEPQDCPPELVKFTEDEMGQHFNRTPNVSLETVSHAIRQINQSREDLQRASTRSRLGRSQAPASMTKPTAPSKPRIFLNKMSDITKEEHAVLVNSSNTALNMKNGQVSRALLEVGGQVVQEDLYKRHPSGIKMGDVAVSVGGKLMCKRIFHCCLPEAKDAQTIKNVIRGALNKCLRMAEERKLKSIGFPALGTGTLNYPPNLVAEAMYETVMKYGLEHLDTEVSDVIFILHKKDEHVAKAYEIENSKYKELLRQSHQSDDNPSAQGQRTFRHFEQHRDNVTLVFVANDAKSLEQAAEELKQKYKTKIISTITDAPRLDQWEDYRITMTANACMAAYIDVTFNYTMGRLELRGLDEKVREFPIDKVIKDGEEEVHVRQHAALMAKQVKWSRIIVDTTGEELEHYDLQNNYRIEKAYREGKKSTVVMDDVSGQPMNINFITLEETPENPNATMPLDAIRVIRKNLLTDLPLDAPLPEHWKKMTPTCTKDTEILKQDCDEYRQISSAFLASYKNPNVTIVKIERIQNVTLYKQYMALKKQMETQIPGNKRIERDRLWHGTQESAIPGIIQYGFNRSYSDLKKNAYGDGVYFATEAEYSSREAYAKANSVGERRIFLCKVLVGEYTKGCQGMRTLPEIQSDKGRFYNSAVDDTDSPTIFVAFSDVQAYPDYLIVFK